MYKKIDAFYNCIDMGDLIYSLLFCKILNVKKMYVDGGCNTVKFNWDAAKFLLPLLKSQEYLETVELYKDQEYDCNYGLHPEDVPVVVGTNLTEFHASKFNIEYDDRILHDTTWLTVDKIEDDTLNNKKILINRTERYHGNENFYRYMLSSFSTEYFIFAGLKLEYDLFCKTFGVSIDFIETDSSIQLAQIIDSVPIFLGNESLICSIAKGLGKTCYVEYGRYAANYLFDRQNIFYF